MFVVFSLIAGHGGRQTSEVAIQKNIRESKR